MNYFVKHKEGLILTLILHLLLLFILLKSGFFTPLPLPEEKGVLVDFGMTDVGMGEVEPSPKQSEPVRQLPQPSAQTPPPQASSSAPKQAETGKEEVMTQDFEESAAIDQAKKKQQEQIQKELLEKKRLEDLQRQKQITEDNRKRDSLQRINEVRIAEQRRLAEIARQDSIKRANDQAKIAQIDSRAKNVFGTSGQGTSTTSQGEGTTYKPGNQGSPDGTPGVKIYGQGGGEGVSFSLTGRSAESLPKPYYPGNEEGIVVVEISVDKYGKVTKATPGVKGSTSLEAGLLEAARKAAVATRFDQNLEAPAFQTGTITYRFVLN